MTRQISVSLILLLFLGSSFSCRGKSRIQADMDDLAVEAYCHKMMQNYDYINSLPRYNEDKQWSSTLFPNKEPIDLDELAPHVEIVDVWEWAFIPNQKMYVLSLDEEGQRMIKEWAGESMTENWARLLQVETKLTLGLRNGEPYLVSF